MSRSARNNKAESARKDAKKTHPSLDLCRTAVNEIFLCKARPWDAIRLLKNHIRQHGHELPYDEYDEIAEDVWVHITAYISPTAKVKAPAIICGGAKICHFSFVEGSVIGAFATVGEMSTVKDSIMFDKSKLWGHNSLCSSVLGYETVLGHGTHIPDTRLDGLNVTFDMPEGVYFTDRPHAGAIICDGVKVGASCVINPGSVIDTGSLVYPLSSVSGYVYPYTTVK